VKRDAPRLEEERDVHTIKEDSEDINIYTEKEKKRILCILYYVYNMNTTSHSQEDTKELKEL